MTKEKEKPDVYSSVRWSAAGKSVAQSIQLVVSLVMARLLAPEYFGLMAMAIVVTGFLSVFQRLGLASALVQRKQINDRLLSSVFFLNLALCLALTGLLVVVAPLIGRVYDDVRVGHMVAVLSVTFTLSAFATMPYVLLQRDLDFRKLALREILGALATGITGVVCAIAGYGVWSLVTASIVGSIAQVVLFNLARPWRPQLVFSWSELRSVFGFGLNITGYSVAKYFSRQSDILIIGITLGATSLGYYGAALRFIKLPMDTIAGVLARVLFPTFSRMQEDRSRLIATYLKATGAIAFVVFPAMFGLCVVAEPLIQVALGETWLPVVPILQVLSIAGLFQASIFTCPHLLLATGQAATTFRLSILNGGVCIIGFLIGSHWGLFGVAVGCTTAYAIITAITFTAIIKIVEGVNLNNVLAVFWRPLLSAIIMASLTLVCRSVLASFDIPTYFLLAVSVGTGVVTYVTISILFQPCMLANMIQVVPAGWFKRILRLRHFGYDGP